MAELATATMPVQTAGAVTEGKATSPHPAEPQAQPAKADTTKQATAPQKHKIKVNGQEREYTTEELIVRAQKAEAADEQFKTAAQMKSEIQELMKLGRTNPLALAEKTGMTPTEFRKWAEDWLYAQIKEDEMSPEQKAQKERDEKLRRYEEDERKKEEEKKQALLDAERKQHAESYEKTFMEALGKTGLPKTPFTVMRMAQLTMTAEKRGIPVTPEQIASLVREDYVNEHKQLTHGFNGDQLIEWMGPEALKLINQAQLSKYKQSKSANVAVPQEEKKPAEGVNRREAWRQFTRKNRIF